LFEPFAKTTKLYPQQTGKEDSEWNFVQHVRV
jgi:hypothetical protein